MKRTIIFTVCLLSAAGMSYAQNLDPTVEVSKVYEGKLIEAHKPSIKMTVPDSVERFDLTFDYSVFDSPYKGTDSFRPYLLDLRPDASPYTGKTLYLRAGAGYTLHPVGDVVWSPKFSIPLRMSVYGHHHSYVGSYRDIAMQETSAGHYRLTRDGKNRYKGYETETSAGVNGRTDWNGGFFSFDVGYYGIASNDIWSKTHYDAFRTDFRVASLSRKERYFFYDVDFGYNYGASVSDFSVNHVLGQSLLPEILYEHDVKIDATLGPMLSNGHGVLVDVDMDLAVYGGNLSSHSGDFALTPKYVFHMNRWNLEAGVKIAGLFSSDFTVADHKMHSAKGQYVYPAVNVNFEVIRSYLDAYLKVDGGNGINSYSGLLSRNRHLGNADYFPHLDNSVNRVTAALGIKGNIASRFGYDFSAGYSNMANDLLWGVHIPMSGEPVPGEQVVNSEARMYPLLGYASWQSFFASLKCNWHSEDVEVDAAFDYRPVWGLKVNPVAVSTHSALFRPTDFRMHLNAVYNWEKRIYAGLHCEASSASAGLPVDASASGLYDSLKIPGWVDLGLSAEYRYTRKLSFWLYGGNLLNMTVQRTPLIAERGASFTIGVTLNL